MNNNETTFNAMLNDFEEKKMRLLAFLVATLFVSGHLFHPANKHCRLNDVDRIKEVPSKCIFIQRRQLEVASCRNMFNLMYCSLLAHVIQSIMFVFCWLLEVMQVSVESLKLMQAFSCTKLKT